MLGTAFALGSRVLTCWHCIRGAIEEGLQVGLAPVNPETGVSVFVPIEFQRSGRGHDLAVGPITWNSPVRLTTLTKNEEGLQVYSYGYPLTDTYLKPGADEPTYRLHRRILKGYVTRTTTFELPGFPEALMCELDMQAPPGMSGAPILRDTPTGGTTELVGILKGHQAIHMGDTSTVFGLAYPASAVRDILVELD